MFRKMWPLVLLVVFSSLLAFSAGLKWPYFYSLVQTARDTEMREFNDACLAEKYTREWCDRNKPGYIFSDLTLSVIWTLLYFLFPFLLLLVTAIVGDHSRSCD
jgi:hypothetical protein